jgi:3-dehydroquinate dehydratase
MIVHVIVPMHRHSLAPEKIAEWMGHMLDSDNDQVQLVTVADEDGEMQSWTTWTVR